MTPPRILQPAELETAFQADTFLLFKHSLMCPVSAQAFNEYMHFLTSADVPTGWISVTDERPLSNEVAERTGVLHESPQAFVLRSGEVQWHASHGGITRAVLTEALGPART